MACFTATKKAASSIAKRTYTIFDKIRDAFIVNDSYIPLVFNFTEFRHS